MTQSYFLELNRIYYIEHRTYTNKKSNNNRCECKPNTKELTVNSKYFALILMLSCLIDLELLHQLAQVPEMSTSHLSQLLIYLVVLLLENLQRGLKRPCKARSPYDTHSSQCLWITFVVTKTWGLWPHGMNSKQFPSGIKTVYSFEQTRRNVVYWRGNLLLFAIYITICGPVSFCSC